MTIIPRDISELAAQAIDPNAYVVFTDVAGDDTLVELVEWESDVHPKVPTGQDLINAYNAAIPSGLEADWEQFYSRLGTSPEMANLLIGNASRPEILMPAILFVAAVMSEDPVKVAQTFGILTSASRALGIAIPPESKLEWNELITETQLPVSMILPLDVESPA